MPTSTLPPTWQYPNIYLGSSPGDQYLNLYPGGSSPTMQGQSLVAANRQAATNPAANAAGLLNGAGEVEEADPRGSGGFDLTARLYRVTGRHSSEIATIKQQL